MFRATQTDAKMKRDQVKTKGKANITHYQVGRKVRQTIVELGGTMPEDLPTPEKSAKGGQRLEFEYSTTAKAPWRIDGEMILQRNLQAIGIKLDIQNYPYGMFINSLLSGWNASPPTGAVAGRYDIAEFEDSFNYDPDDSWLLACDQVPPKGQNVGFYCNPALDALYKQELATADPGLRQQIFQQIHQIYTTQFPFIVLYSPPDIAMVRKGTHNYQPGPLGAMETINIWEWWCDNGKC